MVRTHIECVAVVITTLLRLNLSASPSNPDDWTTSCGVARRHQEGRAPGQSYPSPLGSSPWQVAIFSVRRLAKRQTKIIDFNHKDSSAIKVPELSKSKSVSAAAGALEFLCVGTIINPSIVITAASCLFIENTKKFIRPERLRVIAAKQLLSIKHEIDAQTREVQIVKLKETYEGDITSQADNIAILASQRPFFFNEYVQPACVDVDMKLLQADLLRGFRNNTIEGAAFGLNKQALGNGELREAVFRFQNLTECRRRVSEKNSIQSYLHDDKFCINTPSGMLPEDTGMGLVTLIEDRYYLQGILSENIQQEFSVVTNVSEHTTWLKEAVKKAMDNIQCKNMFICNNKACINPSRKCDGFDDCGDGSDESAIECRNHQPGSGAVERSSCVLPSLLIGGLFVLDDRSCVDQDCILGGGDEVAPGKSVRMSCGQGTTVPDNNRLGSFACLSTGKWSPEEPKCIRQCEPLSSPNLVVTCEYNYNEVNCNKYMRPGTVANYHCATFYTLVDPVSSVDTKCLEGGRWLNEPPECVPECGVPNPFASSSTLTIAFGNDVKNVLAYPWQVGLHNKNVSKATPKWEQHCGGSLISSHLVLTAAHCLHLPNKFKRMDIETVLVTAGKYKRDFHDTEEFQQASPVKEMIIPQAYNGFVTHHAHDISILELERPFKMSNYVLPICLKFGEIFDLSNTEGTIVGWGYTEVGSINGGQVGRSSPVLKKAVLPLIDLETCRRIKLKSKDNFHDFLTFDKFCGRFVDGSGPQQGDSGGGVIVQKGPKWYVVGVSSIKDSKNTMAALTNIHIHQTFIRETMRKHKGHFTHNII